MRKLLRESKRQLALGTALILLFFALYRLPEIAAFLAHILAILTPFVLGACLAFILDIPVRFLERLAQRVFKKPCKYARPIAVLVVMLTAAMLVAGIVLLVFPEIVRAVNIVADFMPEGIRRVNELLDMKELGWLKSAMPSLEATQDQTAVREQFEQVLQYLLYGLTASTNMLSSAVEGVWSVVLGVLSALYMLLAKQQLCRQTRQLMRAYMRPDRAEKAHARLAMARGIFAEFVEGQALMAPLTGVLVFVGMLGLGIPSAALVAVLAGVFAIIPMFGSIFAWVMGALLIVMQSPIDVVWFTCLFVAIQVILGNLVYPRVIGNSVGLPPFWTLFAISVGGGLMGVTGMLLFVPLGGVCYAVIREKVQQKEAELKAP